VTLKGQGRDPDMVGAQNFENGWTYTVLLLRIYRKLAPAVSNGHVSDDIT